MNFIDVIFFQAELAPEKLAIVAEGHVISYGRLAQGIAVSHNCDLIVAVVVGKVDDDAVAKAARRFLETNTVQAWLNATLEGK